MALEEIHLDEMGSSIPPEVSEFLIKSEARIDAHFDAGKNKRFPQFVPCDPKLLYVAMEYLLREGHVSGDVFCEWGSGFGVGTCLASLLGFEVWGIEIEEELVLASRELADSAGIEIQIALTSYLPEGMESYDGLGGNEIYSADSELFGAKTEPRYEGMEREISEVDLFFVYPWPSQHEFMRDLFDAVASEGAVLLAYYGDGEMCAYRKEYTEVDW